VLSFSEHQLQQEEREYVESIHGSPPSAAASPPQPSPSNPSRNSNNHHNNAAATANTANVPTEQERQILLLMLLAQVCALHDPTPRTFTVHVLELFERGILDRQSIHFLFELGLVPTLPAAASSPTTTTTQLLPPHPASAGGGQIVATTSASHNLYRQRSMEVSAIRSTLEQQERLWSGGAAATAGGPATTTTRNTPRLAPPPDNSSRGGATATPSWSAEHHPLSLSRYQREFEQQRLLSAGSFGEVFHVTNKLDGRDYAMKRVPFYASGYSKQSLQQVTREVQCLAACDHPYVVRYYTSWLEPSWTFSPVAASRAGSESGGKASVLIPPASAAASQRLLTQGSTSSDDMLLDYFRDSTTLFPKQQQQQQQPSRRTSSRRFSFDNSDTHTSWAPDGDDDESSASGSSSSISSEGSDVFDRSRPAWEESSRDDSYLDGLFGRPKTHKAKKAARPTPAYRYQICLFIQMQLCHPSTLGDWIRARNRQMEGSLLSERLRPVLQIFQQVCAGLAHVHEKGIVHRDLKPANIFASQDGAAFRIGDFGLSKLLQTKTEKGATGGGANEERLLLIYEAGDDDDAADATRNEWKETDEPSWNDPLTAGVGTASYASPEQVASRSYGKEADIFSMGLILLELLCCFSTEHERIQTFHDCRFRRDLPDDIKQIPALARTILQCTDTRPESRPSAESLRKFALLSLSAGSSMDSSDEVEATEVEILKRQLAEKQREVDELKGVLLEKDKTIAELGSQVTPLRVTAIQQQTNIVRVPQPGVATLNVQVQGSPNEASYNISSSSSEDEM
jgi:serine/threonine protein kinase